MSIIAGLAHRRVDAVLASGERLPVGAVAVQCGEDLLAKYLFDGVIFGDWRSWPGVDLVLLGQPVDKADNRRTGGGLRVSADAETRRDGNAVLDVLLHRSRRSH